MSIFNRIFATEPEERPARDGTFPATNDEERALERYRYMVRTAPPETLERAHEQAFARLTPEQRTRVLDELRRKVPPEEAALARSIEPSTLARFATRAEYRQPGTVERTLGGAGAGFGNLLGTFAAAFAGSMIAQSFFATLGDGGLDASHHVAGTQDEGEFGSDQNDQDLAAGEAAGEDFDGGDFDP